MKTNWIRLLSLAVLATASVSLCGCPKVSQVAYSTIVGATAFTDKVSAQHPECGQASAVSTMCVDLRKAISANNALIDAVKVYCAGPNFDAGGACDEPTKGAPGSVQALSKLQAAISAYNQAAADLKGVIQ